MDVIRQQIRNGTEDTEIRIRKEREKTRSVLDLVTRIAAKAADKRTRSSQLDSGTQRRAGKKTYLRRKGGNWADQSILSPERLARRYLPWREQRPGINRIFSSFTRI